MRGVVGAAVICVGALLPVSAWAQSAQVRVVWTEEPGRRAVVSWSTREAATTELVWSLAPAASAAEYPHRVAPARSGPYDEETGVHFHHAVLTELSPSQVVHFRIVTAGAASQDYWFRTAPSGATPFTLLYGGDSRSDSKMRREMNRRIRELVAADPGVLALAHGGDYIATGSSWPQWNRWLDDWQLTIGEDGQVLPIIPARGNHEGDGELYNRVFGFPGQDGVDGDWFVTRIGQDFALITLDSNVSQGGVQRTWLDMQLRAAQDARWIAVNYHRPAYPAVKSPGGALQHWVPLFEQYNVDFVLESDGHVLKRTPPIRGDQPDPTGVVYLGEGGLGVPQRTPDLDRWYLQPPGMAMTSHHVQTLRVTTDRVFYAALDQEGEVLDRYEFAPKRLGHVAAPSTAEIRALPVGPPPPTPTALPQCTQVQPRPVSGLALVVLLFGSAVARRRPPEEERQRHRRVRGA